MGCRSPVGSGSVDKRKGGSAVSCAKTAELIKIPFGLWTCVGSRKRLLHVAHIGATWQIRLNRP